MAGLGLLQAALPTVRRLASRFVHRQVCFLGAGRLVHTLRQDDGWIEDLKNTRLAHQPHEKPHLRISTIWTHNGRPFHIRPLTTADKPLVAECFNRLSTESKQTRCFGPKRELTPEELDYYTNCDMKTHFGVGILTVPWKKKPEDSKEPTRISESKGDSMPHGFKEEDFTIGVGCGRWVTLRSEPHRAEAALTVMDEFQSMGMGRRIMEKLVEGARFNGLHSLEAVILPENRAAKNLVVHHSHIEKAVRTPDGIVLVFSVPVLFDDSPHMVEDTMGVEELQEHGLRATLLYGNPASLHLQQRFGMHVV